MDFHEILKIAGGVMTFLLFIPMIVNTLKFGGGGQSFATWLLWAALDGILIFSVVEQHGNFLVALGFAAGDVVMATILLCQRHVRWSRFETIILLLVIACLIVWKSSGPMVATIAATLGGCISGLPGLVTLWRNPNRRLGNIWAGYAVANGLAFLGGTAMTVAERFVPGVFTVFSLLMFMASRWRLRGKI